MNPYKKDVRCKKRKSSPFFYVTIPGRGEKYVSSGQTNKEKAIVWALEQANGTVKNDISLAVYAKDFFWPGKCAYIRSREQSGATVTEKHWLILRQLLVDYIFPAWGSYSLDAIRPDRFFDWMTSLKTVKTKKPMSSAQRKKVYLAITTIFDFAVYQGILVNNRLKTMPKIRVGVEERKPFTATEVEKLFPDDLASVWGSRELGLAFLILSDAGLRPQELCALRWEDWRSLFRGFLVKVTKTAHKGVSKKPGLVSARAAALIEELNIDLGQVCPIQRVDSLGKVFCSLASKVISLNGRTLYSLRHTANTRFRSTIGDEGARLIMGHRTEEMTQHYDHPDDVEMMARARKMVKDGG